MFKKLFKKQETIEFLMPLSGTVRPIDEAPDAVFSSKMMGDGFCIEPSDGHLYSPVSSKVVSIFPTKHCIGLIDDAGYEWLIHFGVDTVNLNGEGFKLMVQTGQRVEAGQLLLSVDIQSVINHVPSLITPVIITNLHEQKISVPFIGEVSCKDKYSIRII